MEYTVTIGFVGPTDCTLCINDREFLIEDAGWKIASLCWDTNRQGLSEFGMSQQGQAVLAIAYEDVWQAEQRMEEAYRRRVKEDTSKEGTIKVLKGLPI